MVLMKHKIYENCHSMNYNTCTFIVKEIIVKIKKAE